jgi:UDP-N-acetylmuramate dehydrogenase
MELKNLSYYKTGGSCNQIFAPTSTTELQTFLLHNKEKYFVLGAGSNSLILDSNWPGVVISLHRLNNSYVENKTIIAQAGSLNTTLCELSKKHHLRGAAWMAGLPGQIGATTRMNARCYGGEISQIIQKITSVDKKGKIKTYLPQKENCFRGYKDTVFMENQEIITQVQIKLHSGELKSITQKMQQCIDDRTKKGHYLYPSCGCVFKNDYSVGVPAGMLIEACGFKEKKQGTAQVSKHHANFIYNTSQATSSDILSLSFQIREKVWQKFGVWLQYEMEILGQMTKEEEKTLTQEKISSHKKEQLDTLREKFKNNKIIC